MDRDESNRNSKKPDDPRRTIALLARRLEEALTLYDALDHGDGQHAADVQSALDDAKRTLRGHNDPAPSPLSPNAHTDTGGKILAFPTMHAIDPDRLGRSDG
jgi:hypothetical protein